MKSDVPFERSSPTQPFPTKPAPFARQSFTEDDVNPQLLTPEEYEALKERVRKREQRHGAAGRPVQSDGAQRRQRLDAGQPGRIELGHDRRRSAARAGVRHRRQPGGAAAPQRRAGSARRAGRRRWRRQSGRRRPSLTTGQTCLPRSTARPATAPISAARFPACRRSSA